MRIFSGASIIDRYTRRVEKHVKKLEDALLHVQLKVADAFDRHQAEIDRHNEAKKAINAKIAELTAIRDRGRKLVQTISTIKNGTTTCD